MKTTVICLGDSITEGIGASDASRTSYVARLALLLGKDYTVINRGRNGATVMVPADGRVDDFGRLEHYRKAKEDAAAAKERGDKLIISIMLGTNDADVIDYGFLGRGQDYYDRYRDVFEQKYTALIDGLAEQYPDLRLVLNLSPYSYDNNKHESFGNLESVWRFQKEIADRTAEKGMKVYVNDVAHVTSPAVLQEKDVQAFFADGLHPNDLGHLYFAHHFYLAVKAAEAL